MTIDQPESVPEQFIRVTYEDCLVSSWRRECILKLDAQALYNIAAKPMKHEPETVYFFDELVHRGAVLHDVADGEGGSIPAMRILAKDANQIVFCKKHCHYQNGEKQDPEPGTPAEVDFSSRNNGKVIRIVHFQQGAPCDPASGVPCVQEFDENGLVIKASGFLGNEHYECSPDQLHALNIRKGLIAPALPPSMQRYVIRAVPAGFQPD